MGDVVKFSKSEAGIALLADQYKNPVIPADKEGYDALKEDIKVVAKIRTSIDKERKIQTAEALAHQRAVNAEGNKLIDQCKAIEAPMRKIITDIDEAEEKRVADLELAEAERLEKIKGRIERVEEFGMVSISDTLEKVERRLKMVTDFDPTEGFDEFAGKAGEAKQTALKALTEAAEMLKARAKSDELAAAGQKAIDEKEAAQKVIDDEQRKKEVDERAEEQRRLRELEQLDRDRVEKEREEKDKARKLKSAPDREKLKVFAQLIREIEMPDLESDPTNTCYRVSHQLHTISTEIDQDAQKI